MTEPEIEKAAVDHSPPREAEKDASSLEEGKVDTVAGHSIKDGDEALKFLRRTSVDGEIDEIDEKKLVRKIDWMIVPLMWSCYFLQVRFHRP